MAPTNMRFLVRGTATILGLVSIVSVITGVATVNSLIALNSVGFVGSCALGLTVIFYSVGLDRVGLTAARKAAVTVMAVLAGSALLMNLVFFILLCQVRFQEEAARLGLPSIAGVLVLTLLASLLVMSWHLR